MILQDNAKTYLLQFLTGLDDENLFLRFRIGYTDQTEMYNRYDLVFVPSGFFDSEKYGTEASIPVSPLPEIEGVPFLYGKPLVEKSGKTVVVHADLPASAFFFLSRYEEICRRDIRDKHGRFPGRESLLYRNGLLTRPLVDEYAVLVRKWLREAGIEIPEPKQQVGRLWLTHDVDAPFFCKGIRALARETLKGRGVAYAWKAWRRKPTDDPYYTFAWMEAQESRIKARLPYPSQTVYFLKAGGKDLFDRPKYGLTSKRIRNLLRELASNRVSFGLHGSYSSGKAGSRMQEKKRLEMATGRNVLFFRNHFLRSCEPEHFRTLEQIGITDDFTMGYADVAGFRLGTSRPVVWIDPVNGSLSRLVLHPLTVMDNTLYQKEYMDLGETEAQEYCTAIFRTIRQYGGDICLLWHNTTVTEDPYPGPPVPWARHFYTGLLDSLAQM